MDRESSQSETFVSQKERRYEGSLIYATFDECERSGVARARCFRSFRVAVYILSVIGSPAGWDIVVRAGTAGVVRFTVAGGRPIAMRAAIQETLEAQV